MGFPYVEMGATLLLWTHPDTWLQPFAVKHNILVFVWGHLIFAVSVGADTLLSNKAVVTVQLL